MAREQLQHILFKRVTVVENARLTPNVKVPGRVITGNTHCAHLVFVCCVLCEPFHAKKRGTCFALKELEALVSEVGSLA